jgi:hypothetical protein
MSRLDGACWSPGFRDRGIPVVEEPDVDRRLDPKWSREPEFVWLFASIVSCVWVVFPDEDRLPASDDARCAGAEEFPLTRRAI